MLDPEGVLKSGDPYAVKLQKEARGAVMTRSPGMTRSLAVALLDLIDLESQLEKSQFAGTQISDRPLLQEDIEEGRALFLGTTRLKHGGPACMSCHTVNSIKGLGGGRLGLNLTRA
jgi:mono/diheme cytochrome c family protein